MVMLDYNFDDRGQIFELDAVFSADALKEQKWEVRFPLDQMGEKMMAVFIDIYGNEARILIGSEQFGWSRRDNDEEVSMDSKPKKRRGKKAKAK